VAVVDPIPEDIERFLDENIESIDQLEVLRVLGDNPQKEWAAAELAQTLQVQTEALAAHPSPRTPLPEVAVEFLPGWRDRKKVDQPAGLRESEGRGRAASPADGGTWLRAR
jgi:hypothetical protein